MKSARNWKRVVVLAVLLLWTQKGSGAERSWLDSAAAQRTEKIGLVAIQVRLSDGAHGAAEGKEIQGDYSIQTLEVELWNRAPRVLENLNVKYALFKQTRVYGSGGLAPFKKHTTRSKVKASPVPIGAEMEVVTLKPGERRTFRVTGRLSLPATETKAVARGRTVVQESVTTAEEVYGYMVEVFVNDVLIEEKLDPQTIRDDIKAGRKKSK